MCCEAVVSASPTATYIFGVNHQPVATLGAVNTKVEDDASVAAASVRAGMAFGDDRKK